MDPRGDARLFDDRVDSGEFAEQWFERVEAERVLRIAPGQPGFGVDFEKHAVHAGADSGRRQRLDVLRLARGDAVATARQLQAVSDVEDDGNAHLSDHRKRTHVDDQVVVPEAGAPLGDEYAQVARVDDLRHRVPD